MLTPLTAIAFPRQCICCGSTLETAEHQICGVCCRYRFELYEKGDTDVVLPESILMQESLWIFEKGGVLQDLLHSLKFENLVGIGLDVGRELGKMLSSKYGDTFTFFDLYPLLVPVPLHNKRHRKRGYNQARAIAEGVHSATGWPLLEKGIVRRVRYTDPQTGLTVSERERNVRHVFSTQPLSISRYRLPVIVDDVLTTGATTMELANQCLQAGAEKAAIATVARA